MTELKGRARFHGAVVTALVESIHKRFSGLLQTLQMQAALTARQEPFEQLIHGHCLWLFLA